MERVNDAGLHRAGQRIGNFGFLPRQVLGLHVTANNEVAGFVDGEFSACGAPWEAWERRYCTKP